MFPGLTSKLSESVVAYATTINVNSDIVFLGTGGALATIIPHFGGGFSGILFVIPVGGTVVTATTGNIANAVTMPADQVTVLVYSKRTGLWYVGGV